MELTLLTSEVVLVFEKKSIKKKIFSSVENRKYKFKAFIISPIKNCQD